MSIIYKRLKNNVTNELYCGNYDGVQFQFLVDNCVSVWDDDIWLMLESGGDVYSNGLMDSRHWITIFKDGIVICR